MALRKDCAVCFYCMKNVWKLTAEKNKELAYTSVKFKNWKKTLECFNMITKKVNATKKQQLWKDKLDLCKIENDFISKNDEHYNQFKCLLRLISFRF